MFDYTITLKLKSLNHDISGNLIDDDEKDDEDLVHSVEKKKKSGTLTLKVSRKMQAKETAVTTKA